MRLHSQTMFKRKKVAVVGQGVIGLTSARRLLDRGFAVTVLSKEELEETTSLAAGAYWWPHKAYPAERISAWAQATYDEYRRLREIPESGVHFEQHFRFCIDPDESAWARHLVDEWHEIDGAEYGIQCHEAYAVTLPVIDVPVFMPYLRDELVRKDASIRIEEVERPEDLFPEFDLVVNCTGVWARHFADDPEVYPIRGQSVRISKPDGLNASTRLYRKEDEFTLVLPRTDDVILGGTAHEGEWNRKPSQRDTEAIFERCADLVPGIAGSEILGASVGLRPGRPEVRLELELLSPDQPVIHNYGHGGGGYTVAWGCADEVARLGSDHFTV